MKLTISFNNLTDLYTAVLYAYDNNEVTIKLPKSFNIQYSDVVMCNFVSGKVFNNRNLESDFTYSQLVNAADFLHQISPNTFYPETVFAVNRKDNLRKFVNHFRTKEFRQIQYQDDYKNILNSNVVLKPTYVLSTAPAYRVNYSSHIRALIKTLIDKNVEILYDDIARNNDCNQKSFIIQKYQISDSPIKKGSMYLPTGEFVICRSGFFYVLFPTEISKTNFDEFFENYDITSLKLISETEIKLSESNMPWESFARALKIVGKKTSDFSSLKLHGGNFQFVPSAPDVIGYADCQFDLVKQLGIDVNKFRDTVFDFGTDIELIIERTYDYYNTLRNGKIAFDKAVDEFLNFQLPN